LPISDLSLTHIKYLMSRSEPSLFVLKAYFSAFSQLSNLVWKELKYQKEVYFVCKPYISSNQYHQCNFYNQSICWMEMIASYVSWDWTVGML
jgi:hypothetical protein